MKTKLFILIVVAAALVSFTVVSNNKSGKSAHRVAVSGDRNMSDKNQFN